MLVARPDGDDRTRWTAINACLVPAAGLEHQEVVTAEGLGAPDRLHPVQREMADRGGSQCGYCTPGFVCSMAAEFYRSDRPPARTDTRIAAAEAEPASGTAAEAAAERTTVDGPDPNAPGEAPDHEHGPNGFDLHALSGNLCRCTGYRPIRDAAYALGTPHGADPLYTGWTACAGGTIDPHRQQPRRFRPPGDLDEALSLLADVPTPGWSPARRTGASS